ncbi:hypothetical protein MS2017_1955 [Bathymodiolus thermophilus thioautotrophic gill symbiont]|uniref:Uncharacterized protein n=1 Tax=Bathymodiolus thermophilus thioautotrophic gill symbiont TaxID=2360 RepID=A0A3G3IP19_9GAMM|nr:hypothetical protein MS2017_1955 [Bathymodiolus thermophilus thioautotrophic gill symbiont]
MVANHSLQLGLPQRTVCIAGKIAKWIYIYTKSSKKHAPIYFYGIIRNLSIHYETFA